MDNSNTEHYEHKYYKHVADEKNADAVAWSFVNGKKFVKFPFNFPEILPDEIRANVTFTGLCHSDSFAGRGEWNIRFGNTNKGPAAVDSAYGWQSARSNYTM